MSSACWAELHQVHLCHDGYVSDASGPADGPEAATVPCAVEQLPELQWTYMPSSVTRCSFVPESLSMGAQCVMPKGVNAQDQNCWCPSSQALICNCEHMLQAEGVTFSPHQLASYKTPNFFTGQAASALRDAQRPSSAADAGPASASAGASATRHPAAGINTTATPSSRVGSQEPQTGESAPGDWSRDQSAELPLKRRSRERQPTQRAIEAGLAPALAGHSGQGSHRNDASSFPGPQHAQQGQQPFASQSGVALTAGPPSQHLQAGMPVQ